MMHPPIIYSLFPRLAGTMPEWLPHSQRARQLGFNWVHLNPMQLPGSSNSLYAIKDFYRINPLFVPAGCTDPVQLLRETVAAMHGQGLRVMLDLVVNHTATDSPLVDEHPAWFRRDRRGRIVNPSAIDPGKPGKVTVWRDLAEVDNEASSDRKQLWAYWTGLVEFYQQLGFDGFRCDAAYKVPAPLWKLLIERGRTRNPDIVFAAETLGCRMAEVRALAGSGFDYLFNSSKWWNFDQPWCLDQHEEFGTIAPSIAFPETHDTERVMAMSNGLLQVQKQRYAFAAAFSAGLLMPIGYEYCAKKRLDVVKTTPESWEEPTWDISDFIRAINQLKSRVPIMQVEGQWRVLTELNGPTVVLRKRADEYDPLVVVINKDWHNEHTVTVPTLPQKLGGPLAETFVCRDGGEVHDWPAGGRIQLRPAEVVYVGRCTEDLQQGQGT